jgi:hypothetical protein
MGQILIQALKIIARSQIVTPMAISSLQIFRAGSGYYTLEAISK